MWERISVISTLWCGNYEILLPLSTISSQNFRETNFFTKELYCKLVWRKKFCVTVKLSFFHTHSTVWKNEKFSLTEKKFSWNQLFSNFFSKTVTFKKFCPKKREREFPQFSHCVQCTLWKNEKFTYSRVWTFPKKLVH